MIGQWYWVRAKHGKRAAWGSADDPDVIPDAAAAAAPAPPRAAVDDDVGGDVGDDVGDDVDVDTAEAEADVEVATAIQRAVDTTDTPDEASTPSTRWLGCVVHVGSNYARLCGYGDNTRDGYRVHFDVFERVCTLEPDPEPYLATQEDRHRRKVQALMGEIQRVAAALGAGTFTPLAPGTETTALAVAHGVADVKAHQAALVQAKEQTLPALFAQMKREHEAWVEWMRFRILPSQAQAAQATEVYAALNDRIFTVELYAGLIETVTCIQEGPPAAPDAKVHIHQRRHYMDEECLANYTHGGMHAEGLADFEAWLCKPENLDRILPHPRSIVAFRIRRREHRDRAEADWRTLLALALNGDPDKYTYLYLRNGAQVYQLATRIDFDAELFPDTTHDTLVNNATLYVNADGKTIDQRAYDTRVANYEARARAYPEAYAAWAAANARYEQYEAWRAQHDADDDADDADDDGADDGADATDDTTDSVRTPAPERVLWPGSPPCEPSPPRYELCDRTSLYYDDAMDGVVKATRAHNKIAVVVQGLLDRSPVFHPHPPWRIWTPEGAAQGIVLVHDATRALVSGPAPDFEAYRAAKNATIRVGTRVTGQHDAWLRAEAQKENARRANSMSRRQRDQTDLVRYRPPGNPGPGVIATVTRVLRNGNCVFTWTSTVNRRQRVGFRHQPVSVPVTRNHRFVCPQAELLNVDAYVTGDYKQFYADPRTRMDYVVWAPLLLVAEDASVGIGTPERRHLARQALARRLVKAHAARRAAGTPKPKTSAFGRSWEPPLWAALDKAQAYDAYDGDGWSRSGSGTEMVVTHRADVSVVGYIWHDDATPLTARVTTTDTRAAWAWVKQPGRGGVSTFTDLQAAADYVIELVRTQQVVCTDAAPVTPDDD